MFHLSEVLCLMCLHLFEGWPGKCKAVRITFDLYLQTESNKLYIDMIPVSLHSFFPLKEMQVVAAHAFPLMGR